MKRRFFSVVASALIALMSILSSSAQSQVVNPSQPLTGPVPVAPAPIPTAPMPDLIIVSVQGVPDEIATLDPNGECPFFFATVTIKNIGNKDAWFPAGSWIIGGPSQYTNIASSQITNIRFGEWKQIRAGQTWTATLAGKAKCLRGNPVEVRFQVDPQNVVQESNERNNDWAKTLVNRAVPDQDKLPDLVVDAVTFTPLNPTMFDRVMVSVAMRNQGAGPAIFCDPATIWMANVEPMTNSAGGAGYRVIRPGEGFFGGIYIVEPRALQVGCYRVRVTVDPNNQIPETSETNNTKIAYLSIGRADCSQLIAEDQKPKLVPVQVPVQLPAP